VPQGDHCFEEDYAMSDVRAEFRKKLIEDATFRQDFAANPTATLKTLGLPVPEGVNIPSMSLTDLEARIGRLKASVGGDLSQLSDPNRSQEIDEIMRLSFNKSSGELGDADLSAVAGGSISAYACVDW